MADIKPIADLFEPGGLTKANAAIAVINKVIALKVKVVNAGASQLSITDTEATLTISTKDINLGTIAGAKGGNAALTALIAALKSVFTVTDSTT